MWRFDIFIIRSVLALSYRLISIDQVSVRETLIIPPPSESPICGESSSELEGKGRETMQQLDFLPEMQTRSPKNPTPVHETGQNHLKINSWKWKIIKEPGLIPAWS